MKNWSLAKKFIVSILLALAVIFTATVVFMGRFAERFLLSELTKKGESNVAFLAGIAAEPLLSFNFLFLEQYVVDIGKGDPDIRYAVVFDKEGKPVTHKQEELKDKSGLLEFTAPIQQGSERIGTVKIGFSTLAMRKAVHSAQLIILGIALTALVMIAVLVFVVFRSIVLRPLGEMVGFVGRVAEGDLSGSIEIKSRDELGLMGNALSRMNENIGRLIGGAQATSENVAAGSRQLNVNAEQLSQGADSQSRAVAAISDFMSRMNEQAGSVAKRMEHLARNSEDTSSSIMEMISSIEQVAQNAEALSSSVATSSASVEQILTSNKSVAQNTDSLNGLIGQTTSAITQIDASIKEVQSLAQDARQLTEEAKERATSTGAVAVQQTIGEMNQIRQAVLNLSQTVGKLTVSVRNIGDILVVIDDVAEQTNLLALNAAIIAAQAGDHGRGFAIVASEIRDLAERTSASTKEISKVITGIQQETGKVEALVQEGVNRVDAGVGAVDSTNDALKKIIVSTERAADMSARIATATAEQAQGSLEVARSIHEVSKRSTEIADSSSEQARGSETVMRSVDKMRDLAEQVRRATVEQTAGARLIAKASENATSLAQQVTRESQEGRQLSERAVREVATIQTAAKDVLDVASRMRGVIEKSGMLAEELGKSLSQFRK